MVKERVAALVVAGGVIFTLSSCAIGATAPATSTAQGEVHDEPSSLTKGQVNLGQKEARDGEDCGGENVSSSTQVSIADADGTVLGFTTLESGRLAMNGDDNLGGLYSRCVFTFDIGPVPLGVGPYEISVDGLGSQQVAEQELPAIELHVR